MGYRPPEFVVEKFVDELKKRIPDREFAFLVRLARNGRMRLGQTHDVWGPPDLQAG